MSKTIESLLILTGLSSCLFSCSPVPKSASPTPNAQAQHEHEHEQEHEHEHEEEGEVALSPEQIKLSGVVAEKVSFRDWRPSLRLPATLAADADLEAHISARAAGVITRLLVRQGDSVRWWRP